MVIIDNVLILCKLHIVIFDISKLVPFLFINIIKNLLDFFPVLSFIPKVFRIFAIT